MGRAPKKKNGREPLTPIRNCGVTVRAILVPGPCNLCCSKEKRLNFMIFQSKKNELSVSSLRRSHANTLQISDHTSRIVLVSLVQGPRELVQ